MKTPLSSNTDFCIIQKMRISFVWYHFGKMIYLRSEIAEMFYLHWKVQLIDRMLSHDQFQWIRKEETCRVCRTLINQKLKLNKAVAGSLEEKSRPRSSPGRAPGKLFSSSLALTNLNRKYGGKAKQMNACFNHVRGPPMPTSLLDYTYGRCIIWKCRARNRGIRKRFIHHQEDCATQQTNQPTEILIK